jgi:hypothetical protein
LEFSVIFSYYSGNLIFGISMQCSYNKKGRCANRSFDEQKILNPFFHPLTRRFRAIASRGNTATYLQQQN